MRVRTINPEWLIGATVQNHDGTPMGMVESVACDWPGVVNVRIRSGLYSLSVKEFDDLGRIRNPSAVVPKYINGEKLGARKD
jgi:hypothetical protein